MRLRTFSKIFADILDVSAVGGRRPIKLICGLQAAFGSLPKAFERSETIGIFRCLPKHSKTHHRQDRTSQLQRGANCRPPTPPARVTKVKQATKTRSLSQNT